jgi:hypothetical protein
MHLLLLTPVVRADQPVHDAVVVLFDTSASMSETMEGGHSRMEVARPALRTVVAKVPPDTWLGILTFEGWQYELGPRDDARLGSAIDGLRPDGKTPLGKYLKVGADRLLQERDRQHGYGTYRLIVVTDGQATDEADMVTYAAEVPGRRLRMDVIGLAMAEEHVLSRSAHSYQPAASAEQLDQALRKIVVESRGDGDTPSEDFGLIAGIPDDVAAAWVDAATAPAPNWPLGSGPPEPEPDPEPATSADAPSAPKAADPSCALGGLAVTAFFGRSLLRRRPH